MAAAAVLPEQVRKQSENADARMQALQAPAETPSLPNPPAEPPAETLAETPAVEASTTEAETPTEQRNEGQDIQEQFAALEARFKTLQGKYNAEVPVQAARIRDLVNENQTLLRLVSEMRQAPAAAKAQEPEANEDLEFLRTTLGNDVVDRLLRLQGSDRSQELQKRLDEMNQKLDRTTYDSFKQQLTVIYPDWPSLDKDQGFLQWLSEEDPFAGVPRQQLLNTAVSQGNPVRAAQFFSTYAELQKPAGAKPNAKAPATVPSLASQQTVKKTTGQLPPAAPAKKYTQDEYRQLMTQAAQLVNRDPKKAKEIETELDRAVAEGRVTR